MITILYWILSVFSHIIHILYPVICLKYTTDEENKILPKMNFDYCK